MDIFNNAVNGLCILVYCANSVMKLGSFPKNSQKPMLVGVTRTLSGN